MAWALNMYPEQLRPSLETQANYTVEWLELADQIGAAMFSVALVAAVRGSEFFPVIAKIRQCAGVTEKQQKAAGADAAWLWLQSYLRKWPNYGEGIGRDRNAPEIPSRIFHAARMVGGLSAIEFVTEDSEPFVRRDFCAAWERYEESGAALSNLLLSAPIEPKMLGTGERKEAEPKPYMVMEALRTIPKAMGNVQQAPLTDAEFEDRKEMLRQQAERLLNHGHN